MSKLKEKGITLVALVVTIIILLILTGVTLNLALSDTGLFKITQNVVDRYKSAQEEEEKLIADLEKDLAEYKNETQVPEEPPEDSTKGPNGKPLIPLTATTLEHERIEGEDKLGNPVTVPKNFKVVEGETVEDGIVIEDSEGNQFVWIPVSNTDGDNNADTDPTATDLINLKDNKKVEITLGRYEFSTSDGKEELRQTGANHGEGKEKTTIGGECYENTKDGRPNGGAGAKDLDKFVESVEKNHGYYIGRYEASFGSGNSIDNYKPQVKVSTGKSTSSMNKSLGILWNFITEGEASKVCQNMYSAEDRDIESDLVNSYAWDTAIVYIQAMKDENKNYANATSSANGNTELKNTGETGDVKCNIYDMAENLSEWTTEYSTVSNYAIYPCVIRGGHYYYGSSLYTAFRHKTSTTSLGDGLVGFRPLLYLK